VFRLLAVVFVASFYQQAAKLYAQDDGEIRAVLFGSRLDTLPLRSWGSICPTRRLARSLVWMQTARMTWRLNGASNTTL